MSRHQITFFDEARSTLAEAIEQTIASLITYGERYRHWAVAFSGGKDSSATVTLLAWLLETGRVPPPESLRVIYADTRLELPPLQLAAMEVLATLRARGISTEIVYPALDDRFFVYMLGRGVPPPNNNTLRWCTRQIKIDPMDRALQGLYQERGEKVLLLTGVRLGESASRDDRIALSCSRDGAECGQGWLQVQPPASASDVLAPLLRWRVCHVWDWLTFEAPRYGFPTQLVAEVYGGDEAEEINARTGCTGCPLATKDVALDALIRKPAWAYLRPLKDLRPLYGRLRWFENRLQKDGERNKDGKLSKNPNRKGPLTMEARRAALATILDIQERVNTAAAEQGRPSISLINDEEHQRILELQAANTWPQRWTGEEPSGARIIDQVIAEGVVQPVLTGLGDMLHDQL